DIFVLVAGCRHWDATDLLDGGGFRITARFHLCLSAIPPRNGRCYR
ncbi:hypothetical protein LINGRAHAP2_LOCUS6655, partial [Linum grandiflorum]